MAEEEYEDEVLRNHEAQRRFTTHVIRATPTEGHGHCLMWGWGFKKGAGGIMHRANWKKRFFALYRVPQGHVLVYYDKKDVDMSSLLGFIDLRKADKIEEDLAKVNKKEQRVLTIATKDRTFHICPQSLNKRLEAPVVPSVQYILGWPVPEPVLGEEYDLDEGGDDPDAIFDEWLEQIGVAVKTEQEVDYFEAEVVTDSTESLPPKVTLRATALNLVVLSGEDDSVALTCTSYDQITSWKCPIPTELLIRLSPEATGGGEGRVIFGLEQAEKLKSIMENHVRKIISHVIPPADVGEEGDYAEDSGGAGAGEGGDLGPPDDDDLGPPTSAPPAFEDDDLGPPSRAPPDNGGKAAEAEAEAAPAKEAAPVEAAPPAGKEDEAPAPPKEEKKNKYEGWATYTDKASGKKYYANKATGQTSWTWPPNV